MLDPKSDCKMYKWEKDQMKFTAIKNANAGNSHNTY